MMSKARVKKWLRGNYWVFFHLLVINLSKREAALQPQPTTRERAEAESGGQVTNQFIIFL